MQLTYRLRRLRKSTFIRDFVSQTNLTVKGLVLPYFIRSGKDIKKPIKSMPGYFQLSINHALKDIKEATSLGIGSILLFGIPKKKDSKGSDAYSKNGIIQTALKAIKDKHPDLLVITDVCLCEYTDHGHCGVVVKDHNRFKIDNDATLELLAKTSVSQAEAGSDMVAPSAMMDAQVKTIRHSLDSTGFADTPIMSYSAKYASSFYGPFREAAESPPKFGDRSSYQMDPRNADEAMHEIELDIQEGADIVMVKPALCYLDIIKMAKERFDIPLAAYSVSGEYSLVKAAGQLGFIDQKKFAMEILTAIRRAGADIIITYWAKEVAKDLAPS